VARKNPLPMRIETLSSLPAKRYPEVAFGNDLPIKSY
jgi:hypothetical protein